MRLYSTVALTAALAGAVTASDDLKKLQQLKQHAAFVEMFDAQPDAETGKVSLDKTRWFRSLHEKYAGQLVSINEYLTANENFTADSGLLLEQPAKHYGVGVELPSPLQLDGSSSRKELVIQYEVKLRDGLDCGGAYIKLLRHKGVADLKKFDNESPFVVMFGPDRCGSNDKVHFIFQHKNPITNKYEEKHLEKPPTIEMDRTTHLYTLIIKDDNTYKLLIDQHEKSSGSLLKDFSPAVNPSKMIDDPEDFKPEDWVDEAKIADPEATKPEDWDENAPLTIPDMDATKPDDWLEDEPTTINDPEAPKPDDWEDEEDGEWVPPQIPNPKCGQVSGCGTWVRPTKSNPDYKGKWRAPLIDNPAYKGEWAPRKIENPAFFEDLHPARMDPIGAVAVEVWTMSSGIIFDNFWLGYDAAKAKEFGDLTWAPKSKREKESLKQTDELRKQEHRDKLSNEGALGKVKLAFMDLSEMAQENPAAAIATFLVAIVGFVLVMVFACGRGSGDDDEEFVEGEGKDLSDDQDEVEGDAENDEAEAPRVEEVTEEADSAEDEEEEEEEEKKDEEDAEPTIRQRKKAPKMD